MFIKDQKVSKKEYTKAAIWCNSNKEEIAAEALAKAKVERAGSGGQASTTYKVILHKEMADNLYHVNLTSYDHNNVSYNIVCNNRTTTDFEIYEGGDGAKVATKMWEVKGFIKQN